MPPKPAKVLTAPSHLSCLGPVLAETHLEVSESKLHHQMLLVLHFRRGSCGKLASYSGAGGNFSQSVDYHIYAVVGRYDF